MYVTNIQRFSVDDGLGIRTTVFLSGCNMKCRWCHNPENLEMVMKRKELKQDGTILEIQNSRNLSVQYILDEVKKDKNFYRKSGGGITISGGEPALQFNEVQELLKKCKKDGINTVLETAFNYDYEVLQKLSAYVDLYIVDCKAISDDVHIRCTGVSNKRILENIIRLSKEKQNMRIRIPVIPQVNITYQEIKYMADFLSQLNLECIELLPYHKMGVRKYKTWNIKYTLDTVDTPSDIFMNRCKDILSDACDNVIIQGKNNG